MDQGIFGELLEDPGESDFTIYACAVNLMGLYSNTPIQCRWSDKTDTWISLDGEFSVAGTGLNKEPGRVTFASTLKRDVENWILGVRATHLMLRDWAMFDCINCGRQVASNGKNLCIFCNTTKKQGEIILKPLTDEDNSK